MRRSEKWERISMTVHDIGGTTVDRGPSLVAVGRSSRLIAFLCHDSEF